MNMLTQMFINDYDVVANVRSSNNLHIPDINMAVSNEKCELLFKISLNPNMGNTYSLNRIYAENVYNVDLSTRVYLVNNEYIVAGNLVNIEYVNKTKVNYTSPYTYSTTSDSNPLNSIAIYTYQFRVLYDEIFSLIYTVLQPSLYEISSIPIFQTYYDTIINQRNKIIAELEDKLSPYLHVLGSITHTFNNNYAPSATINTNQSPYGYFGPYIRTANQVLQECFTPYLTTDINTHDYNLFSCDVETYIPENRHIIKIYQTTDDDLIIKYHEKYIEGTESMGNGLLPDIIYENKEIISKLKYLPREVNNTLLSGTSEQYYQRIQTNPDAVEDFLCLIKYMFTELDPFNFTIEYNGS